MMNLFKYLMSDIIYNINKVVELDLEVINCAKFAH